MERAREKERMEKKIQENDQRKECSTKGQRSGQRVKEGEYHLVNEQERFFFSFEKGKENEKKKTKNIESR